MKARARRIMQLWRQKEIDPRQVGKNAATHCRPCACWMCQAESRDVPAPRERAAYDPEMA